MDYGHAKEIAIDDVSRLEPFRLVDLQFPHDEECVVAEFVTDPVLSETEPVRLHLEVPHVNGRPTLDQVKDVAWHALAVML